MSQTIDVQAFVAFEAAGYNRVVDVYHRLNGPITSRAVDPLLDAAAVGPATRVLDVATGPGYAGQAAARGADAVGIDVAAEILALARELWPDAAFRIADAHALHGRRDEQRTRHTAEHHMQDNYSKIGASSRAAAALFAAPRWVVLPMR